MLYLITASRVTRTEKGHRIEHLPIFYLNADVQGIVSEQHAKQIALNLLGENVVVNTIFEANQNPIPQA